jgi:acyl-CoA reductase-like NAD-dependent aldehyde dehydrogenase
MATMIKAVDPRTGQEGAAYEEASVEAVDAAVRAAAAAAADPALADRAARAAVLRGAAARLRARQDDLVDLVGAESGLPAGRVAGELARTGGQLEAFAAVVEDGEYRATAADLGRVAPLAEEHFGPAVVLLTYGSLPEAAAALERAGGQLTATIHAQPDEHADLAPLVTAAVRVAGRVVFDGVPTGVAVTYGMQHGGPYPASSAEGTTSVGMTALRRFLRPVAFQDAPQDLLPEALRDGNPLGIRRRQAANKGS